MITIKFRNLNKIINRVERLGKLFDKKTVKFLDELSKIGINTADVTFSTAQYDGTNDVEVDDKPHWVSDTKLYVSAHGKSITFIEFGSGVFYPKRHPKDLELGFIRGEFGLKKGSHPPWVYVGEPGSKGRELGRGRVLTYGNPPAMAMYQAAQDMRDSIEKIAKEVYCD